ncbi:NADH-quinone oxidoreductase subunit NuoE [Coralliovum pocilloporae]|uniref:NADH-quinone oxidoreductase subunit NuoE n=1 Tax=Coralliovum pocilloporae TaxID=3066369 RepID=UPI00330784C2
MSVRRLHHEQPESFAFSAENVDWANMVIAKYPEGRQASAVIPLLMRAQEQEGWVSRPAIEAIADMLDMPYIRVLEVATFYTQFQLQPVGRKAHVQVCGTTPCMLRGAEDLIRICKNRIAAQPFTLSDDGDFSWEEVECAGACVNAPMVQVFKDTYEDLTPEALEAILDSFARGETPKPGPQIDRIFSAPEGGPVTINTDEIFPTLKGGQESAPVKEPAPAVEPAPTPVKPAAPADMSGKPDDLKKISGVGKVIEGKLQGLGITTFAQIAAWTEADIAAFDEKLSFKGRIQRDNWIEQAKQLSSGGETAFSKRVEAGDVPSSSNGED